MTLSRLISWMSGVSEVSIRALPAFERLRLATECRRILLALEPPVLPSRASTTATPRPQPKCGILYELRDGRGRQ
jgi:hypothetical protein